MLLATTYIKKERSIFPKLLQNQPHFKQQKVGQVPPYG